MKPSTRPGQAPPQAPSAGTPGPGSPPSLGTDFCPKGLTLPLPSPSGTAPPAHTAWQSPLGPLPSKLRPFQAPQSCSSPGTLPPTSPLLPTQLSDLSLPDAASRKPPRPRPWVQCPLPSPGPVPSPTAHRAASSADKEPFGQGLASVSVPSCILGTEATKPGSSDGAGLPSHHPLPGGDAPSLHAGGQSGATFTHRADEHLGTGGPACPRQRLGAAQLGQRWGALASAPDSTAGGRRGSSALGLGSDLRAPSPQFPGLPPCGAGGTPHRIEAWPWAPFSLWHRLFTCSPGGGGCRPRAAGRMACASMCERLAPRRARPITAPPLHNSAHGCGAQALSH